MLRDLARPARGTPAQPPRDLELDRIGTELLETPEVAAVVERIHGHDTRTMDEQLLLARTPAPPFQEETRGEVFAGLLRSSGAGEPWTDETGNVLAWLGLPGPHPLVLSAHLDTVFPASQEIEIRQEGDLWVGPGVSDDARGLAALLATVRALVALTAADAGLRMPLLLVGSVGEEGIGDLRGMRGLFGPGGAGAEARGFISLDGAGVARVISSGVGSRRFRVDVTGPGGHSWVDWGRPNPIQILGRAIAALDALPLPAGCTLNVGRIQGGTSINAIPTEAWMEVEVRSEDEDQLGVLEAELRQRVQDAMDGGRAGGAAPPVTADGEPAARLSLDRIGQRPGGRTPMGAPLVRAAVAATRAVAGFAEVGASSTDANLPMSLGIPAITLGAGGEAGDAHTPREWYRNRKGPDGVVRALLTLLVLDRAATGP